MNKRKITVAVTGLNNTDNPGPGIPVVRGILQSQEFDAKIIGLAYENLEPGIYMRDYIARTFQIPYPTAGSESLLKRIAYINSIEKIDVLIPNFDAELYTFMKTSSQLKALDINTFLPTLDQFEERQKSNLNEFGKKYEIKIPESKNIFSEKDLFEAGKELSYPLFIKGKFYDAYLAYNFEVALVHYHNISSKWGLPVVIQKHIQGTEVNVVAVGDGNGNTIGAVPMRKQYITDKGKAWAGITLDDENLINITKDIISKTKWRGGMELELIKTEEDDYYLIEINPRLPAWVYLAVGAGQNLPEAIIKLALGDHITPFTSYDFGKLFIRYSFDMICEIKELEKLVQTGEY